MPVIEKVYKSRNNTNDFTLKEDGEAVDLSTVEKMELIFEDDTTISSETDSAVFDWSEGGGKLILALGGLSNIEAGESYAVSLIVYDSANQDGVNWGKIYISVE